MNALIQRLQTRIVVVVLCLVLAAFALTIAVGFACVGIYLLLSQYMAPTGAAFLTAGSCILFATLILFIPTVVSKLTARRPIPKAGNPPDNGPNSAQNNPTDPAMALGAALSGEFLKVLKTRPRTMIIVSLVAGFVIGLSPRLRAVLTDLLKSYGAGVG